MKAAIWTKYGPPAVLQYQEVAKPVPKDNELLVKIMAATVGAWDCETRSLKFPLFISLGLRAYIGLRRPTRVNILGQEFAGVVESVGKDVKQFKVGDQVFAATGLGFAANAQYKCLAEDATVAIKPGNITYEEAAGVPIGGIEALHFLRKGNIQTGETVLVNGAGGSIGTFAVQLAKYFGAQVTAVDSSEKLDMLRAIGADHVIDYRQEDFSTSGLAYDVILDVVGKSHYSRTVKSLKPNGRYLLANPGISDILRAPWTSMSSDKKVISGAAVQSSEELTFLKKLIEAGEIKSIVDRSYPLEETIEAHRYVESGRKMGHVIISIKHDDAS